jgi:hypothetical protein
MSTTLVKITIVLNKEKPAGSKEAARDTPTGAAFKETQVVVTDSAGMAQQAVFLNGKESPAWTHTALVPPAVVPVNLVHSVKKEPGVLATVVATDLDVYGNALGKPVTQVIKEDGTPAPTFVPTVGIAVTADVPKVAGAPGAPEPQGRWQRQQHRPADSNTQATSGLNRESAQNQSNRQQFSEPGDANRPK